MENKSIILIGQTVNHHSLYQNMLLFLQEHYTKITFLSRDKIVNEIEPSVLKDVNVIIDNSLIYDVFKKNIDLINSHYILISDEYNSAYLYLREIKFTNKKKLIILHNINRWTKLNTNIFSKNFIDWFFRKKLFSQFNSVIAIAPNVVEHYKKTKSHKKAFFFSFDEDSKEIELKQQVNKAEISIIIPGVISSKRRNYIELLNVLKKYYEQNKNSKIIFKFLGRIEKDKELKVYKLIEEINNKYNNKIHYWKQFVPTAEFEKEIETSDFIFSNIVLETKARGIKEFYGISKESGISFIAYKYAKPVIAPTQQNILTGFDSQLIKFNNYNELFTILAKIENLEIDINSLKQNAINNRAEFNKLISKEKQNLLEYLIN